MGLICMGTTPEKVTEINMFYLLLIVFAFYGLIHLVLKITENFRED